MHANSNHPAGRQHSGRPASVPSSPGRRTPLPITIDCGTCVMRATPACTDCMVSYLCDRDDDDAVVFDLVEYRAVRLLADAGLLPSLRHREADASG
jgi:hypothetical protein